MSVDSEHWSHEMKCDENGIQTFSLSCLLNVNVSKYINAIEVSPEYNSLYYSYESGILELEHTTRTQVVPLRMANLMINFPSILV